MPIEQAQVDWAVAAFKDASVDYSRFRRYYQGKHDLGFATPKFNQTFGSLFSSFAYNRCRPVVDALANKLKVTGFQVSMLDAGNLAIVAPADGEALTEKAMTLWRLSGMAQREGEVYVESALTGDAYGVVWYDADPPLGTGLPRIWPNKAEMMRVKYDDDGRIILAAKSWMIPEGSGPDSKKRRLTFYTPTEIVRLITVGTSEAELAKQLGEYTLVQEVNFLGQTVLNPVTHDLGRVPVLHFANNAPMLGENGISELQDVIPLQDALNKAIADMLVAMEYNAFPQRWVTGVEQPDLDDEGNPVIPWKQGPGHIWFSTEKDASFGDFAVADPGKFLAVQNQFDGNIARVSQTPLHHLLLDGDFPSGEALKTAEAPFTSKTGDRQRSHGATWAEGMAMVFWLAGIKEPLLIDVDWQSAEPRSQREQAEIGKIMADAGVPIEIAAKVMGLDEQDLAAMSVATEEKNASRATALEELEGERMATQIGMELEAE